MRNHVVELGDKAGKSCRVRISTPSAGTKVWHGITENMLDEGPRAGDWRSLDKGFIRYNSGSTFSVSAGTSGRSDRDCYLLSMGGQEIMWPDARKLGKFGIKLFVYEDWTGVNDSGEGFIIMPWAVGLQNGRITWSVID